MENLDKDTEKFPRNIKKIVIIISVLLIIIGISIAVLWFTKQKSEEVIQSEFKGRYIDVHTHIALKDYSLEKIVDEMDEEGIDMMIIMEVPTAISDGDSQLKFGIPTAKIEYPDKFLVLYGGEAITLLDRVVTRGRYTKSEEEEYINLLEKAMQSGLYSGFGEIALRHASINGEGADITIPGNHPWIFILSDIAAKYEVPIDIHLDFESEDIGIPELEELLDYNGMTKIIWSHTSWSRTRDIVSVELMRQLLEEHPNLYSSIKIQTPNGFLDQNEEIFSEWLELFEDYPDRFMIGSDIKPGLRENEFIQIQAHREFLRKIPSSILPFFERENAKRIFNID